jgi:uncharacterized protein YhdP
VAKSVNMDVTMTREHRRAHPMSTVGIVTPGVGAAVFAVEVLQAPR